MRLPLSGITVLSLEQAIAAPLGSRHLADWDARVIKIERLAGRLSFMQNLAPGAAAKLGLDAQTRATAPIGRHPAHDGYVAASGDRGGGKASVSGCTRTQDDRDCRQIRLH